MMSGEQRTENGKLREGFTSQFSVLCSSLIMVLCGDKVETFGQMCGWVGISVVGAKNGQAAGKVRRPGGGVVDCMGKAYAFSRFNSTRD
jgi:hypothetical protein